MTNYRYTFDHKARKVTCPACGEKTLRTLKSVKTDEPCDPRYGVCERVNSCQYSRYPTESEKEFVPLSHPKPMTRKTTWRCPDNLVAMTTDSRGNVFGKWLVGLYGQRAVDVLRMYRVGTYPKSDKHPEFSGSAIFWQIGSDNKHRSGKIIKYGPDGKRVKDFGSKWIHSVAYPGKSMDDLGIGQVPFGEHLIYDRPEDTVCVVESEKSAIICAIHYPQHVWVATGGSSHLTLTMCMGLAGRNVVVIPDVGMYDEWSQKALDLEPMTASLHVSDYLEACGLPLGDDIADLLLGGGSFPFPEPEPVETYVVGEGFVEQPKKDMQWLAEVCEPVAQSPVERILARPGVRSLVEGLDLDLNNITVKPYEG